MTRLGMIVRCDQGGLGNQTYSLWKHLKPCHTLLLDLPTSKGRGVGDPAKYRSGWTELRHHEDDVVPVPLLRDFAKNVDTVLTVETLYSGLGGFHELRDMHVRTVLVANPELFGNYPADATVVPTPWELKRMPPTVSVLPHPTEAPPEKMHRQRRACQTFLHVAAPAMLDRNGTDIVMKALHFVEEECQLVVHAPFMAPPWETAATGLTSTTFGKVHVRWDSRPKRRYWDVYDVEADVLLLPRRYGGLCLPVQEAAACGMPSLMTDLLPQSFWPGWRVPTHVKHEGYAMKGGRFDVHDVDPEHLANAMDAIVRGEEDVETMSAAAWSWARSISWDALLPDWRELVG